MKHVKGQNYQDDGYCLLCDETVFDPEWDAAVASVPGGDLAQTTMWAATRQRLGFSSHHIRMKSTDGRLIGGCIINTRRLMPGVWVGSVTHGPILFNGQQEQADRLVAAIQAIATQCYVKLLLVKPPEHHDAIGIALKKAGFRVGVAAIAPEATLRLNIQRDDSQLMALMKSGRRREIRKGLGEVEVVESSDVNLFHQLHSCTGTRQGFRPLTAANLHLQWEWLHPSRNSQIFIAKSGGVPFAGLWLIRFADTVTFKLTGWDSSLGSQYGNAVLHWVAMRWARDTGAAIYDFGGIDPAFAENILTGQELSEKFTQSTAFFKLQFGGYPVLLPRTHFVMLPRVLQTGFGGAAQQILSSGYMRRFANVFRNG